MESEPRNDDDDVEEQTTPPPPSEEESSPEEKKLSAMHQRWLVDDSEAPRRSPTVSVKKVPTKSGTLEPKTPPSPTTSRFVQPKTHTIDTGRDGQRHRSRSMDMRPPAGYPRNRSMDMVSPRYPRNRSIDMVSPGIHLQAIQGTGAFRLDARQGLTVDLQPQRPQRRSSNEGQDTMQLGRQKSQRKINVSNQYLMQPQPQPIAEDASLCESLQMREHLKRWPSAHRQASRGDLSDQPDQSFELGFVQRRRMSASSMMSDISIGELEEVGQTGVARRALISPEEMASAKPNHPHPGLEYPPLYFLIKQFPFLMSLSKSFFQFRWRTSYPLQRRIPFSRGLRKVNIFCTIGELFLILPFFATLIICSIYSFVYPSVAISGHTARTPLIFAFATAMHNSLLTLLLGIPFERALFYHKMAARLSYVCGLLHTYVAYVFPENNDTIEEYSYEEQQQLFETSPGLLYSYEGSNPHFGKFLVADSVNIGGTLIMAFMTTMMLTALPCIRRRVFELFYYIHLLCCIGMLGAAFYHTGFLVPLIGSLTWGVDFLVRKVIMAFCLYPRKASVRIISESVVEICFPKTSNFNYNPGQYILLAIPKLSMFEWHPFSISSSPEQKIVTLHIRKAGSWTSALYDLAEVENEISILMEGPYGSVGVDVTSDRYKMVMLFSGGIGVTPMQALCNQLMYEHSTDVRSMKKLSFVWIERDPSVMQKVDVVRRSVASSASLTGTSFHDASLTGTSFHDEANSDFDDDIEVSSTPGGGFVQFDDSVVGKRERVPEMKRYEPHMHDPQGIASTLLSLVPASRVTDEALEQQYPIESLDEEDEHDGDLEDDNTISTLVHTIFGRKDSKTSQQPMFGRKDSKTSQQAIFGRKDSKVDQSKNTENTENSTVEEENREESFKFDADADADTMCQSFLDEAYVGPDDCSSSSDPLDLQVYLTARNKVDPALVDLPFINRGRPDIKQLFRKMRDEAIENKESRVAVCVCAPKVLVNMCQKACVKYSDRRVRFDFHFEVFD